MGFGKLKKEIKEMANVYLADLDKAIGKARKEKSNKKDGDIILDHFNLHMSTSLSIMIFMVEKGVVTPEQGKEIIEMMSINLKNIYCNHCLLV